SSVRKKVDMKMWNAARRGRHFSPAVRQGPENESSRSCVVPEITGQGLEEERDVLPERIKLVVQRPPRPKQVTANFAVNLNHERRFGFPIGVVGGQEIGEQLPVFVNRVDRRPEKSGLATKSTHGVAVRFAITAD